jgi:hypothetical protein
MRNKNLPDVNTWGEFRVGDIFTLENCRCDAARDLLSDGNDCYYIGAKKSDNGVMRRVAYDDELITKGNGIIFICDGQGSVGYSNYMDKDFIGSTTLTVGRNKYINKYVGMFLVSVLDLERPKYSFGRKYRTKLPDTIIKLPKSSDGTPDWAYMERYIKTLRHKPITTKIKQKNNLPLDTINWEEFLLGDLFTFHKGCRLTKQDMIEGHVNFLGAISENNGVRQLIDIEPMFKHNCITVNYNGSVGEAFYQSNPFWASDDVNVLYAKDWTLNKYIALFIVTVIKANRYKFSYGRKWTLDKMKESPIKLPVTAQGIPDWDYMEKYIKSLPYSDKI